MARTGRPSKYSAELAAELCDHIRKGLTLREVARQPRMPSVDTICCWIAEKPDFSEQYTRAKLAQMERMGDELLEIADDGSNDWMERKNEDGEVTGVVADHEHINRSRLRVDTRKWLLSKLAPKKYGDRTILTNPDGGPVEITLTHRLDNALKRLEG